MEKYARSSDGQKIHYQESGEGNTSIIFVHGWLGNGSWWEDQKEHLKNKYHIVQMDLAGHGKSDKSRTNWTSDQYAEDIKAVADQIKSEKIILVGHSMSGAYVLEASLKIPAVKALILVDTVKDLDDQFTEEMAEQFLFVHYRNDFKNAVENILPEYLFAESTPIAVKERLQSEFLQNTSEMAIDRLKPLYKTDFRNAAKQIQIPVRAINADVPPTNIDANRKYLKDFDYVTINGVGHYPMLEKPDEFNILLENTIEQVS